MKRTRSNALIPVKAKAGLFLRAGAVSRAIHHDRLREGLFTLVRTEPEIPKKNLAVLGHGHIGAASLLANEQMLTGHRIEGFSDRALADADLPRQLHFRGYQLAGLPGSVNQPANQSFLDLKIKRSVVEGRFANRFVHLRVHMPCRYSQAESKKSLRRRLSYRPTALNPIRKAHQPGRLPGNRLWCIC